VSEDQPTQSIKADLLELKERIAAQVEQESGTLPAAVPQEITSKLVIECLDANELGDGLLYATLHRDKFVYAKGVECWYAWKDHSWVRDEMDLAVAAVENVALCYAKEIPVQAASLSESLLKDDGNAAKFRDRIGQLHGRIKRLRKDSGRKNCLTFAHTNPVLPLAVRAADFDLNPWLLACANGVINLKTCELEPGNPSDYISKRARAAFPKEGVEADTSKWTNVLLDIYNGDDDLVAFTQRLYGYGITGLNIEHIFPVLFGRGRNGKSLVAELLSYALGDYAGPVPAEMLLDSNRSAAAGGSSPEIMALKGLRLAIASETDEGRKFSAAKVKWLTGGDTLTGRGLYDKHLISFTPTHLLMLLTNHKPNAPDTDFAFWERCKLIPHKLSFITRRKKSGPSEAGEDEYEPLKPHEREVDKDLARQLRENLDIILAWMVRGCLEWQRIGLAPPKSVREATNIYRDDENYLGQFIEAACIQAPEVKASSTELYDAFCHWYKENVNKKDKYLPSQKSFGQKLQAADLFERKRLGGYYHYVGIAVSDTYQNKMVAESGDDSWQRG